MDDKDVKKKIDNYLKFTGMAFQMIAAILLMTLVGYWLDGKLETQKPYFTAGMALFGVIVGIYLVFKELPKE